MSKRGDVRIGTSGWSYRHWVGPFYPAGTRSADYLTYYASHFRATEVNNTFYSLQKPARFRQWYEETPPDFLFACKASRYITHMKKLKDPAESIRKFFAAVDHLGDRLGPILFQLPPHFAVNPDRLGAFLRALPEGYRHVFEFRDASWFDDRVYDLLAGHGAGLVIYDLEGTLSPVRATGDLVYVRLHGPCGEAYRGSYADAVLREWAMCIAAWRDQGREVYCFFDNDEAGHAALDAARLQRILADA